jgi:hypothetical protein
LDYSERMALRPVLWQVLFDRTGNAFETLFHDIMTLCVPGFVDVRTHGKLGDQGSDGLSLHDGKLYACYAPESPDAAKTIAKLRSDAKSALAQRAGQFKTFVFVHNDVRGVHPEIATELAALTIAHPQIVFETLGYRHLRDMLGTRSLAEVETVLQQPLPVAAQIGVGLTEMTDLLNLLESLRQPTEPPTPATISVHKLEYSALTADTQSELRDAMKYSEYIENYYSDRLDVTERDEVAARFSLEYQDARTTTSDPEMILLRLRNFLAGTRPSTAPAYRAQTAVLAYFFQSCDIFENAPPGWAPTTGSISGLGASN